ncbi:hypothetical protein RHMOL_Rhmol09G0076300 [Rhododendron molle]|uniref:Uncharacterized protein n=1 Tax=Rhododendron molle TaxID=49168 RepID=A0ACC0MC00_RHOML|nr:hypothetical protein RHMOL_Rhmol09G0076300 [Rhododendron molle]
MMMTVFHEAADNATYSDAKSARVVAKLREAITENEVCDDECLMPPMPIDVQDSSMSSGSHIAMWSYDVNETPINLEN